MQKPNIQSTKSVLAKLLAGENITVVHERIQTAFFDLKNRVLHLPTFENMSGPLYDLLVGHEDGHALYTPSQGWHDATVDALTEEQKARGKKFNSGFKGVLNVCEDARIEKLIKRKYPGIARSFVIGYKDLWERDFFGVSRLKSLNLLNVVDRINIHCKVGTHIIVPFNDEERELLREVERAETWDDVVAVSVKLYERAKQERDNQISNMEDLTEQLLKEKFGDQMMEDSESSDEEIDQFQPFDLDGDDSNEETESASESESESDKETSESTDSSESDASDEESDEESDASDEDSSKDSGEVSETDGLAEDADSNDDDEFGSVTDRIFRERERELVVDDVEIFNYTLPQPVLDNIIVPNRVILEKFFEEVKRVNSSRTVDIAVSCVKRFNDKNMRYINLLAKEFEMRKNASQYARTTQARTGELDMSKLHQYKFSSNLFKKMNIIPKGKNHGMIMFVDMSGSMHPYFGPTIEQTLVLAAFCRKVNIPFDVYGFSDKGEFLHNQVAAGKLPPGFTQQKFRRAAGDNYEILRENDFSLRHLIGSRMVGNAWRRAYEMMAIIAINWRSNRSFTNYNSDRVANVVFERAGFNLNGTPYLHAVMASRPIIEKFRAETQADIVNVIYLTDGEGTGCFNWKEVPWSSATLDTTTGRRKRNKKVYLTDPRTQERVEIDPFSADDQQSKMVEFIRNLTGCKHIGFYIAANRDINLAARRFSLTTNFEILKKNMRDNGFFITPQYGYDQYYYIKIPASDEKEDDYELTENMTRRKMTSTFIDAQESKRKNRVIISRFAQDIATV